MSAAAARPDPRTDSSVRLCDVTKTYRGGARAVRGISFEVRNGEFFGVLGPSGSGKSTTLRMIGGFESVTSGRILIQGVDMGNRPPFQRDVNTVFQSYALFPHLDVFGNVAFGLRMAKVKRRDRERRVTQSLRTVRLEALAHRSPSALSGGEQQRVALARALVNRPSILLLDEPLGALDLKLRKEMQLELKAIQEEVGIAFLHVTHDQDEAMALADRIAVMHDGRIAQVGTPADIYERPASRFVAQFIGRVNLFTGSVVGAEGGRVQVDVAGLGRMTATNVHDLDTPAGQPVTFAVRPERLRLRRLPENAEARATASTNALWGRVVRSAYGGSQLLYEVHLRTGRSIEVLVSHHELSAGELPAGTEVEIVWPAEAAAVVRDTGDST